MALVWDTGNAVGQVLYSLWRGFVNVIPGIVAAIIVLIIGYYVGAIIGYIVKKILVKTKAFDYLIKQAKLTKFMGEWDLPYFFGTIVKWYIFILFLPAAASLVRLRGLSIFLERVALWIPNVILAVIIALIGLAFAEFVAIQITQVKAKGASMIAGAAKIIILIFVAIIALKQAGVMVEVAESSFLIILAGIMLAFGIAFGLGFKEEATSLVKNFKKRI